MSQLHYAWCAPWVCATPTGVVKWHPTGHLTEMDR